MSSKIQKLNHVFIILIIENIFVVQYLSLVLALVDCLSFFFNFSHHGLNGFVSAYSAIRHFLLDLFKNGPESLQSEYLLW